MSIWDKFRSWFGGAGDAGTRQPLQLRGAAVTIGYGPRYGVPYTGGVEQSLDIATVYRCVDVIASGVASLRCRYLRLRDGYYAEDTNSPLHYLLGVQPQPEMSARDFWSELVRMVLLEGNAYVYPRRDPVTGSLEDLVLCHNVSHDVFLNTYTVSDPYSGVYGKFPEPEMIHVYLHTSDGRSGESVLAHARQTIGTALAGNEETANRFENGGTLRGFVTNEKGRPFTAEYADSELEAAADNIAERIKSKGITSLPGQTGFQQVNMSSADMQFLESRKFTVREICRFFGVHPSFVFDDTSNNYKSAEMANVAFLSQTLNPLLLRIENEFTRKLVPRSLCCKRRIEFDRRGVYSIDLEGRASYLAKMQATGALTVNDVRRMENLPPVEGGDVAYISANLTPLGVNAENNQNDESDE